MPKGPLIALLALLLAAVAALVAYLGETEKRPAKKVPALRDGPVSGSAGNPKAPGGGGGASTRPGDGAELEGEDVPAPVLSRPGLPDGGPTRDPVAAPEPERREDGEEEQDLEAARERRRLPERARTATLFQHATHDGNFPLGESWTLTPGLTNAGIAFTDEEASAVDVPDGMVAILYDGPDGEGQRVTIGAGRHNLAPYGFNDRASSVRIAPEGSTVETPVGPNDLVRLYQHVPRAGDDPGELWVLRLEESRTTFLFTAGDGHFEDEEPSAVWIPAGHELILFDEPDGRGEAVVLGPGFHELELVGFNDRASSVRVLRLEE